MATQSVRIGWRPYVTAQQLQTANLLDSYSGAAAAYSLRKLKSSYTGSAIRVRRSSDNTELNIGFDSDGNLDTYSLSAFVGTGNGFVTTWYDQSSNNNHAIQNVANLQPQIVSSGSILLVNNKPSIRFDNSLLNLTSLISPNNDNNYHSFVGSRASTSDKLYGLSGQNGYKYILTLWSDNNYYLQAKTNAYQPSNSTDNSIGQLLLTGKNINGVMSIYKNSNIIPSTEIFDSSINPSITGIGQYFNSFNNAKCSLQEMVFYNNNQTSQVNIESNMNSYYSIYPNPTSVWNLLTSAYNSDTTASSSLKTSLFASYNGESNTNDSKGTNNGTAVGGLTYTAGKIGNAFSFNGSNSYVSLPRTTNQFDFTDFSISAWFNPSLTTSGTIFSNYHYINNSNQYGYLLYLQGSRIRFAIYQGTTSPVVGFNGVNIGQSSLNISTNTWYHVVITKTASNDFKMYINGSLQSLATISGSLNANPVYNSLNRVDIGSQWGVWSLFNGKIDELNTWTKELTASEVSELYNSGNGAQYIGDNFYKPTTNDALSTNNGTAQGGLTYGLGKVGTAFQFNGTNAYVTLPNSSGQFNFTGDFSISCWFKSNTISGNQMIFSNLMYNGGTRKGYYIILASNTIGCWLVNQPTHNQEFYTSAVVSINTWYHLSVTRESGVVKIYLNGTLLATDTNAIPLAYVTTLTSIGAYTNATGSTFAYFNGSIDAFNIWQKALTQSEITELYNSGNGKQYPN